MRKGLVIALALAAGIAVVYANLSGFSPQHTTGRGDRRATIYPPFMTRRHLDIADIWISQALARHLFAEVDAANGSVSPEMPPYLRQEACQSDMLHWSLPRWKSALYDAGAQP